MRLVSVRALLLLCVLAISFSRIFFLNFIFNFLNYTTRDDFYSIFLDDSVQLDFCGRGDNFITCGEMLSFKSTFINK